MDRRLMGEFVLSKGFQTEWGNEKETGVRKSKAVKKKYVELQEVRQIGQTFFVYRFESKEKQFVFDSLSNKKPVKGVQDPQHMIRLRSLTDEPCSIVLNFWSFWMSCLGQPVSQEL